MLGRRLQSICLYRLSKCSKVSCIYVGPCALSIHPMTNWWWMRGYKFFIAFDRRPSHWYWSELWNPSQSLPHNTTPTTQTYNRSLRPFVGPCALPIYPTTNWWRMRRHKSFIAFDRTQAHWYWSELWNPSQKNIVARNE